jgi:hypothetical protein
MGRPEFRAWIFGFHPIGSDMLYYSRGSETDNIDAEDMKKGLYEALDKLGKRHKMLVLPPDITRF